MSMPKERSRRGEPTRDKMNITDEHVRLKIGATSIDVPEPLASLRVSCGRTGVPTTASRRSAMNHLAARLPAAFSQTYWVPPNGLFQTNPTVLITSTATGASTKELMAHTGHASSRAALIYQHTSAERDVILAKGSSDEC